MEFLATLPSYKDDLVTQSIWNELASTIGSEDGICYYKHPVIMSSTRAIPDLTLLCRVYQPMAVVCMNIKIEDLFSVDDNYWVIHEDVKPSPILDIEDYLYGMKYKFDKDRSVRGVFAPVGVIALPFITKAEFEGKFGEPSSSCKYIWSNHDIADVLEPVGKMADRTWLVAKSIFQGVSPLNKGLNEKISPAKTMGEAIQALEKDIALLDSEQHKVAVQIAPGPQRIRGLAGTGKTVILAMKAANIHMHYPDKRILFTFHTQSLYHQTRDLISKFYRVNNTEDPNWDMLQVRHAWGGAAKSGVYYEACKRNGLIPMAFDEAKLYDQSSPFSACCKQLLNAPSIEPYYDYVLVDEAQDFPPPFFRVLSQLSGLEKRIYWAYDELQTLSNLVIPTPGELFGKGDDGNDVVSLEGDDYAGGMEKDFVLHRSYRCPRQVLMLAHAVGLGIYGPRNCVQMLSNKASWETIGYEVEKGNFLTDDETMICRPMENSPNRIESLYKGTQPIVSLGSFSSRDDELEAVARSIQKDISIENVLAEQIVVICLDKFSRTHLTNLQRKLVERGIRSKIPGLIDAASDFAEVGAVTLTSVHRAKGNEAPIVYITNFDNLAQYTEEIESRNRAFTAISRSKGWVRISGSGRDMVRVKDELTKILEDIPCLKFRFPDMETIRTLDSSETSRRRSSVRTAKSSIKKLLNLDREAVAEVDPEELKVLRAMLESINNDAE